MEQFSQQVPEVYTTQAQDGANISLTGLRKKISLTFESKYVIIYSKDDGLLSR